VVAGERDSLGADSMSSEISRKNLEGGGIKAFAPPRLRKEKSNLRDCGVGGARLGPGSHEKSSIGG